MTVKASRASARRQIDLTRPAIDDFLDKLLDSAKFDVVADKIAEKAVDRIMQNLAKDSVKTIERTQVETDEVQKKENKGSQEAKPGGILGISADNGSRVFQINTEALIGKYATIAPDEISLNYKRFTHEMKEKTTPKKYVFDEKRDDKQGRDYKRDSRERRNRYYDDQSDGKRWSDGYKSQDDYGYSYKIRDEKGHRLRSFKHRTGDSADEKSDEPKSTAQNETTISTDLTNKDSSDYDSDSNKVFQNSTTEAPDIDTRSIIRKDGEKLFAFQESPDYDDYHDNLSKLLKLAQKKNGKRSNSSKVEK